MKLHNSNSKTMQHPGIAWKKLLNVATLGVFSVTPFVGTLAVSQADPPNHAPAWGYRRKQERGGSYSGRSYGRGRSDRDSGRDCDERDSGRGRYDRNSGYGYPNQSYGYPNQGYGYPNQGYGYPNQGYGYPGFTGTVTNVKGDDSFDIRIGGDIYNVYTDSVLPRRLSEGDFVQVYGERVGKNDIRRASVRIIENR